MVSGQLAILIGFEGGTMGNLDVGAAPMPISAVAPRTGSFSAISRVAGGESGSYNFVNEAGTVQTPTAVSLCIPFRMDTQPVGTDLLPIEVSLASLAPGLIPEISISTAKKLEIITGPTVFGRAYGTLHWTGTTVLSLATYYLLHFQQYKAADSGASSHWPIRVKLYSDASPPVLLDDSGWQAPIYTGASATTINSITIGQFSSPSTPGLFYFDDIVGVIGGAGAPIGAKVMGIPPTGNSADENTWTGTANKWDDADDVVGDASTVPDDDTTYFDTPNAGAANQGQLFTHGGTGLTTEPIHGVRQYARLRRTAPRLVNTRFKTAGGSKTNGATLVLGSTYEYYSRLMGREPSGNADWTVAKVDGCEFGMMVPSNHATNDARCTQEWLEVAYGGEAWVDDYPGRILWNDAAPPAGQGPGRPSLIQP